VADLDSFGPDEFRGQIRYPSRMRSTNHFVTLDNGFNLFPICRISIYKKTFSKQEFEDKELILNALSNFSDLFQKVEHHMRTQDLYYQSPSGCFSRALQGVDWVEEVDLSRRCATSLNA